MTATETRRLIEAVQNDYPGYEVRITRNDFTDGEVQRRPMRARKQGRKFVLEDWFHVGWCDDLLHKYAIRTYPPARSNEQPHTL